MTRLAERSALACIREAVVRRGIWSDPWPALSGDVAWHGDRAYSLDCHIEGTHFPMQEPQLRWVGRRAVVASASDIVAAGAEPETLTVGLGWPECRAQDELQQLYEGIADACQELGIRLTGGDWQATAQISLHCAVSGRLASGAHARRPMGEVGDVLVVSRSLGDAYVGLRSVDVRENYTHPRLDRGFAAAAARSPAVHGMTDITDGLLREVALMARNSGLGAVLDLAMIPRSAAWHGFELAITDPADALSYLLGSDEYALLAAVAPGQLAAFRTEVEKSGQSVYPVGLLEQGNTLRCSGLIPPQTAHLLNLEILNQLAHETWQAYAQS